MRSPAVAITPELEEIIADLAWGARRADYEGVEETLRELAARGYAFIDHGATRACFDRGDGYVIKVPLELLGEEHNLAEADHDDPSIPLAACHIEDSTEGLPLLVMEKVEPFDLDRIHELPAWCAQIDCYQVGFAADGRLVAYDL